MTAPTYRDTIPPQVKEPDYRGNKMPKAPEAVSPPGWFKENPDSALFDDMPNTGTPPPIPAVSLGENSSGTNEAAQASALDTQVGGDHYKDMPIQPVEFIHANGLPYIEGCIVKYACRHRTKNGAEDVRKIIHYAQLLLEREYGEAAP